MNKLIYIIPILILVTFSCNINEEIKIDDNSNEEKVIRSRPVDMKLEIDFELNDSIFSSCDSIKMNVKVKNINSRTELFLFDEPFGFIPIVVEAYNYDGTSITGRHWNNLSSTLWSPEDLKQYYRELKPNQIIEHEFYVTRIDEFVNPNTDEFSRILDDGVYELKIRIGKNYSETKKFIIKK